MNKTNMQDLIKVIGIMLLVLVVSIGLYLKYNNGTDNDGNKSNELLNVCIADECFLLKDGLAANAWNELEVYVDGKEYDEYPLIYGDITIGSKVKDIFNVFDIKPGYAYINMEVSNGDDTTDIVDLEYEDFEFLEEKYLDAYIMFGYKKENDKYVMVESSIIEEYLVEENTEDIDVLFAIDINGMSGEEVNKEEVIAISIKVIN